jgi:hypothetical protein
LDGPTEVSYCLPGEEETAQWLEDIAKAIRERRLYGFMMQFSAESPVATGEWIEKPLSEVLAEQEQAPSPSGNVTPLRKPTE